MRVLPIPLVCLCAVLAAAAPVSETEPNGFSTPGPQDLGVLGAGGLEVTGTLDPTSPNGLDPGDRDGFAFTMEAAGPLAATVDDGGAGRVFVLVLARADEEGLTLLASSIGAAPLTLARPDLEAGPVYRLGVAAFSDGAPLPYALSLLPENALPPWNGSPCEGDVPEAEPDDDAATATDLGDFTGVICAAGSAAAVAPPGSGLDGDPDWFRFRDVLPVPARLVMTADPGTLRVRVSALTFVATAVVVEDVFGSYREIALGTLEPGLTYFVEVLAEQGTAPLDYRFHLEPVGTPPPPPADQPLDLLRARLRLAPGHSFRVVGLFAPGTGGGILPGAPFSYRLRGLEESFGDGALRQAGGGRLRYRAPRGVSGLRSLVLDPVRGRLVMKGRGLDLGGNVSSVDPMVSVELNVDGLRFAAEEPGEFSPNGDVLSVR